MRSKAHDGTALIAHEPTTSQANNIINVNPQTRFCTAAILEKMAPYHMH